jgi:hypothetical protein
MSELEGYLGKCLKKNKFLCFNCQTKKKKSQKMHLFIPVRCRPVRVCFTHVRKQFVFPIFVHDR